MCVIIFRDPKVEIPFEKIKSAAIVNPDGWGLAVADRGKLEIRSVLDKTNDPEKIAKALEDTKNQRVMLHLRYVTVGLRSLENCHPFVTLTKEQHGTDVTFCHNGTLYSYKDAKSDYSDSYHFNEKFVRPLLARTVKFTGPDELLADDFVIDLLADKAGSNSLFGLLDGEGNRLIINYTEGVEFEGWWASNEYSFNRAYREPVKTDTEKGVNNGSNYWYWDDKANDYKDAWDNEAVCEIPKKEKQEDKFEVEDEDLDKEIAEQCEAIGKELELMKRTPVSKELVTKLLNKERKTFCKLTKIEHLSEMTKFDPAEILDLVTFYPEAATVLVEDLLGELYIKNIRERQEKAA